jgi:hypothetical protein
MPLKPNPAPPKNVTDQASPPERASLARLAVRISSWTSRLLLTCIVLVASLAFGRQVMEWWGVEGPPHNPTTAGERPDDPVPSREVEFGGQSLGLVHQELEGPLDAALAGLRKACRQSLQKEDVTVAPPGPAEKELLRSLANVPPVEEDGGRWRIYELKESPFPMVAGVGLSGDSSSAGRGKTVADLGPRVVTWGLAVPKGPHLWTLLTFHPADCSAGSRAATEVPLPPGSTAVLSLKASRRESVVSFRGPTSVDAAKQFYDHWIVENGWKAPGGWRQMDATWHLRCEQGRRAADVRVFPDARGGTRGLLLVAADDGK